MEDKDIDLVKRYISNLLAISPAKFLIKESQGLYDPLIPISEEVVKQTLSIIQPFVEKYGVFEGDVHIDPSKMNNPFFNSLTIQLMYFNVRVPTADIMASYNQNKSMIKDGRIDIVIQISSMGQDSDFINKFRSAIIHELGHAYDDYMETINSKYGKSYMRYEFESIINREKLAFYSTMINSIEGKLASVISFILKSEREAEQNEFLAEVYRLSKLRVTEEPRKLMSYIINTSFYQNMMNIQQRLVDIEDLKDDKEKFNVTKAFNEIYRDKNVSYEEMCAYLRKRWNYRKNELFKHVTKHLVNITENFVNHPVGLSNVLMSVYEKYGPVV